MLKTAKNKAYLTMAQIPVFARICHMSEVDVIDMYAALFRQKNGKRIDFDLPTMQWLFAEAFRLLQEKKIHQSHPLLTTVVTNKKEVVMPDQLASELLPH